MKKINRTELDKKVKTIKESFSDYIIDPNIKELLKFFKKSFNEDIIQIGDKLIYDFNALFVMSPSVKKKFKNDPIQPITITYKRADILFFTFDKLSELGEEYTMYDSDWSQFLYPTELKLSVLFDKKSYLKEKDPEEWYVETNVFSINDKYTKLINDINFD